MNTYSNSLVIRETQIKTIMQYYDVSKTLGKKKRKEGKGRSEEQKEGGKEEKEEKGERDRQLQVLTKIWSNQKSHTLLVEM